MGAVAVHHVVTGPADAPVVVLSNSLGATHRMWEVNLAALEEHSRVVRHDTRGHGDSPVPDGPYDIDDLADDVVALLDELGVERAHVVGLCTGAHLTPSSAWTDRAATVRALGTSAVAEAVVARWFTPGFLEVEPAVRKESEEIATSVRDGSLLVVADSAHLANAQQPATVTPAILEHLTGATR